MDDELFRALREPKDPPGERDVAERHTDRSHPVTELIDSLREQAVAALRGDFFDAGTDAQIMPLRTVMRCQAQTLRLYARRNEPPYEAEIEFEVRCDRESSEPGGQYTVHGKGSVRYARTAASQAEFNVTPAIRDDGTLLLDGEDLRRRIAAGIRHLGDDRSG